MQASIDCIDSYTAAYGIRSKGTDLADDYTQMFSVARPRTPVSTPIAPTPTHSHLVHTVQAVIRRRVRFLLIHIPRGLLAPLLPRLSFSSPVPRLALVLSRDCPALSVHVARDLDWSPVGRRLWRVLHADALDGRPDTPVPIEPVFEGLGVSLTLR